MTDLLFYRDKAKYFQYEAIKYENEEKYDEAYSCYKKAAENLKTLMKYENNSYSKEAHKRKAIEFVLRAKDIKEGRIKQIIEPIGINYKGFKTKSSKPIDPLIDCLVNETPNVKWSDIAGLEKAKETLKEAVTLSIKFPQLFEGKRKPSKGILLYGQPGTGKTCLAKAAATEIEATFLSLSGIDIINKYMNELEKLVKALFDIALKNKPAIIFLDEIEKVMNARGDNGNDAIRSFKTELIAQMDNLSKNDDDIYVICGTNIPWEIDPEIRKIFHKKIYFSLPDFEARKHMLKMNLEGTDNTLSEEQFNILAKETIGFSGSDISRLTHEALYEPIRKCLRAKYFREVKFHPNRYNIIPCNQKDEGAMKTTMLEIYNTYYLLLPTVCFEDYMEAKKIFKQTIHKTNLKKQEKFTVEYDQ